MLIVAGYVALQNSKVQTFITQKLTERLSKQINSKVSIGKVYFSFFNKLILEDVLVEDQTSDTLFFAETVTANIDSVKYRDRKIALGLVTVDKTTINVEKDSAGHFNFTFILDSLRNPENEPGGWNISSKEFYFNRSNMLFSNIYSAETDSFYINNMGLRISDFLLDSDSLDFQIEELTLNDGRNLKVDRFNAHFHSSADSIAITELNLKTNLSEINESDFTFNFPDTLKTVANATIDFRFSPSVISLYELSQLIPGLRGMDQIIDFSGEIYGKLNDLKGRDLLLQTGQNTLASFDAYVNDITDPGSTYIFLDLKNLQTTFTDLNRIKLPKSSEMRYLEFPESFYEAGLLNYKGNFTGFLTDFVAFGTLTSRMGVLTTDVSVVPDAGEKITYQGKVATDNFKFGELFQNENFGEITFDGSVDGYFNQENKAVYGKFKGEIAQFEINGYNYENITLDGTLNNKRFDGIVNIDDPNLNFDFAGRMNFNPKVPDFDFRLDLRKAMPGKLNLSDNYPASQLSFVMNANFTGDEVDNLQGAIAIEKGTYTNRNGTLNLDGIQLNSATEGEQNTLKLTSDFFDFEINGKYHFKSIANAFEKSINKYLPATNYERLASAEKNKFDYHFEAKNLDSLTAVFIPAIKLETPFLLYGRLDSEQAVFELKGSIPGFSTNSFMIKDIFIGNAPGNEGYASKFRLGEVLFKNGMKIYNLAVDSKLSQNTIRNQISWTNYHRLTYSGRIITEAVFSDRGSWPAAH